MTSTNDGKDVKSNQNSAPKGKTYYIELYKSLDARLNAEGHLSARTDAVCAAWRSVHALCQHSAPSTQSHLSNWLQRHTARTLLQSEWQSPQSKNEHTKLEEAVNSFIQECNAAASNKDGAYTSWEEQLLPRAEWFKSVLGNPWGHPVLKVLLDPKGQRPSSEEILEWLIEERGVVFASRLRQLALSKCDDLALELITAVMDRVRQDRVPVNDLEIGENKVPQAESTTPTFESILSTAAGFADVWDLLTDMEFVLLHKRDKNSRLIDLVKLTPLTNAESLVERLLNRLKVAPREKKIWKNAKDVAMLISQVMIARCMVVPLCRGAVARALRGCGAALSAVLPAARLARSTALLAAPAATAAHLYTLAAAVHAHQSSVSKELKPFVVELYVRAITFGMNELEKLKLELDKEKEARQHEKTLASWFVALGGLLSERPRVRCECSLTAFSVHPSTDMYELIQRAPPLSPVAMDTEPKTEKNTSTSEFGSWANDSRSQTNFVKTSETLNLKQTQRQANVLSTAILTEGEMLGLDPELCQDIAVLLSGPRVKTLSWDMDRDLLLENCRAYMERTHGGTKAVTTELKYLNLDVTQFQHLPEEEDDENDAFYGIEKGYEHLVELQEPEPEQIWEDAFEFPRSDSACSSDEYSQSSQTTRRKKKSKHQTLKEDTDSETDPLSSIADMKRAEKKKERPHSKERSKERKKKTKEHKESDKRKDKEDKVKKKEKKERKKREKKEKKSAAMASAVLVGDKEIFIDSDYDSQGKSSLNSEGNDPTVLYDGQFSMDEIKSPSPIKSPNDNRNLYNRELTVSNGKVDIQTPVNIKPEQNVTVKHTATPNLLSHYNNSMLNKSVQEVREDVKKSITKLIQFRRNKALEAANSASIAKTNEHQTATAQSSLTKAQAQQIVYFNKQQTEKLMAMKNKAQSFQTNLNKTTPYDLNENNNCTRTIPYDSYKQVTNTKPVRQQPQSPYSVPQSPSNPSNTHLSSYERFLQELQSSHNAGVNIPMDRTEKRKDVKPVHRVKPVVPPLVPPSKPESTSPYCAKPIQQKKAENAPNTFSRLSYMHKNKQVDKPKQLHDAVNHALQNSISEELDKRIADLKCHKAKMNVSYGVTESVAEKSPNVPKVEKDVVLKNLLRGTAVTVKKKPSEKEALNNNMFIERPPSQIATKSKTSLLTEKDNQDILRLLGQKNALNPQVVKQNSSTSIPVSTTSYANKQESKDVGSKYIGMKIPTAYSNPIPASSHDKIDRIQKPTMTSNPKCPTISTSSILKTVEQVQTNRTTAQLPKNKKLTNTLTVNSKPALQVKSSPKTYVPKPPVYTSKLDDDWQQQNWEKVLDVLRSHKTPSRGPNALDMVLKKDSFEKVEERNYGLKIHRTDSYNKSIDAALQAKLPKPASSISKANSTDSVHKSVIHRGTKTPESPFGVHIPVSHKAPKIQAPQQKTPAMNPLIIFPDVVTKEQYPPQIQKDDPFISGLPNPDYDILDELIDDDLRKEIGELSSDEESYRSSNSMSVKNIKVNALKNSNQIEKSVQNRPKQKVDTNFGLTGAKATTNAASSSKPVILSNDKVNFHQVQNMIASSGIRISNPPVQTPKTVYNTFNHTETVNGMTNSLNQTNLYYNGSSQPARHNIAMYEPYTINIQNTPSGYPKPVIISNFEANIPVVPQFNIAQNYSVQPVIQQNVTVMSAPALVVPNVIVQTNPAWNIEPQPFINVINREVSQPISQIDVNNDKQKSEEHKTSQENTGKVKVKINERKVLSEVQEKLKEPAPSPVVQKGSCDSHKDKKFREERLAQKRLAILNRNINVRSPLLPIALTYAPLVSKPPVEKSLASSLMKPKEDTNKSKVSQSKSVDATAKPLAKAIAQTEKTEESNRNENSKENTQVFNNIVLRSNKSSSILSTPVSDKSVGRKTKVRLKCTPKATSRTKKENGKLDKTSDTKTNKEHVVSTRVSKRVLNKKNNKCKEIDVAALCGKSDIAITNKDVVSRKGTDKSANCMETATDIEAVLLGSKIEKLDESPKSKTETKTSEQCVLPPKTLNMLASLESDIETALNAITETTISSPLPDSLLCTEAFSDVSTDDIHNNITDDTVEKIATVTEDVKLCKEPLLSCYVPLEKLEIVNNEVAKEPVLCADVPVEKDITEVNKITKEPEPCFNIVNEQTKIPEEKILSAANTAEKVKAVSEDMKIPKEKVMIAEQPVEKAFAGTEGVKMPKEEILFSEKAIPQKPNIVLTEEAKRDIVPESTKGKTSEGTTGIIPDSEEISAPTATKIPEHLKIDETEKQKEDTMKKVENGIKQHQTKTDKQIDNVKPELKKSVKVSKENLSKPQSITKDGKDRKSKEQLSTVSKSAEFIGVVKNSIKDTDHSVIKKCKLDDDITEIVEIASQKTKTQQDSNKTKEQPTITQKDIATIYVPDSPIKPDNEKGIKKPNRLPQSFENKIQISELPIPGNTDPDRKCVRIKLPNKQVLKATFRGVTDINMLFDDPTLQRMLMETEEKSSFTVTIPHSKLNNAANTDSIKVTETVNLISDDEEDVTMTQKFQTDSGTYIVNNIDQNTFDQHKKMLTLKCSINLVRCDAKPKTKTLGDAIDEYILPTNEIPEVIEIDDSSDSDVAPVETGTIAVLKDSLLMDLGIKLPDTQSQLECQNGITKRPENYKESKIQINTSKAPNKSAIVTKDCYIKLVRCDNLLRTKEIDDADVTVIKDDEDKDSLIILSPTMTTLSDVPAIDEHLGLDDGDRSPVINVFETITALSNIDVFGCGRNSPVMEAFDMIACLQNSSVTTIASEVPIIQNYYVKCESEWLITKRKDHALCSDLKEPNRNCVETMIEYEKDVSDLNISNVEKLITEYHEVPSLVSILSKYFEDNDLVYHLTPKAPKMHQIRHSTPHKTKRKACVEKEESLRNKISKLSNLTCIEPTEDHEDTIGAKDIGDASDNITELYQSTASAEISDITCCVSPSILDDVIIQDIPEILDTNDEAQNSINNSIETTTEKQKSTDENKNLFVGEEKQKTDNTNSDSVIVPEPLNKNESIHGMTELESTSTVSNITIDDESTDVEDHSSSLELGTHKAAGEAVPCDTDLTVTPNDKHINDTNNKKDNEIELIKTSENAISQLDDNSEIERINAVNSFEEPTVESIVKTVIETVDIPNETEATVKCKDEPLQIIPNTEVFIEKDKTSKENNSIATVSTCDEPMLTVSLNSGVIEESSEETHESLNQNPAIQDIKELSNEVIAPEESEENLDESNQEIESNNHESKENCTDSTHNMPSVALANEDSNLENISNQNIDWVAQEAVIGSDTSSIYDIPLGDSMGSSENVLNIQQDKPNQSENDEKVESAGNSKLVQTDMQNNNNENTEIDKDQIYLYETEVLVEEIETLTNSDEDCSTPNYQTDVIEVEIPETNTIEKDIQNDIEVEKSIREIDCDAQILENNATLIYKDDSGVVLKGIEYEDPELGTCFVFPIVKDSSTDSSKGMLNDSSESSIEVIQEVELTASTEFEEQNSEDLNESYELKVLEPKTTYLKNSLKRHADMGDVELAVKRSKRNTKTTEKRYRKGKNIDFPKLTNIAIASVTYAKEYKRLFDYYTSVDFSYALSYSSDTIDVTDLLRDWPIKPSTPNETDVEDNIETSLFTDFENKNTSNSDPLSLTLAEEIMSAEENPEYTNNSEIKESNFNMGFGEGSGRVIQNLNGVSKFSAATLSDVKQFQPCLFSKSGHNTEERQVFCDPSIKDQIDKIQKFVRVINLKEKVRSFFKTTAMELSADEKKNDEDESSFPFELYIPKTFGSHQFEAVVQVVQVGQLPVSAAAQNPVTCDPRVTQVSDASPSQCSAENSPNDDSHPEIKTEYTELTTADLSLPLDDYGHNNQTMPMQPQDANNATSNIENIPIETEIVKSEVKIELDDEEKENPNENSMDAETNKHVNDVDYMYDHNHTNTSVDSDIQALFNEDKQASADGMSQQNAQNGSNEKTDQIAHAMSAAGITTTESITNPNTRAHALVNIISQKIRQGVVNSQNANNTNHYPKATTINAMALQQALAQILPPPLNQTNSSDNNQTGPNSVTPQVLHIVQGKNSTGNQITLVDNTQQSVINTPNATSVLHIVQNKSVAPGPTSNGSPAAQSNTFSGISLVDAGLQQGGNQLLHIVNTGNQKNNNAGQLLKRVNLLTNLTNVQGSNEQKMVQFVCKSADGKSIQLNAPHQRSMVLRLQPIETPNVQPQQTAKPPENQDLSPNSNNVNSVPNKDNNAQQEIKSRSVYEENYAKFIQNSSNNKPTLLDKPPSLTPTHPTSLATSLPNSHTPSPPTSLPKFNQAFGKQVFQDNNQKQNDINNSNSNLTPVSNSVDNNDCPSSDNSINLDHMGQISSPPLLLRKPQTATTQSPPNLVQQIKQTIAPMNIQTMHGGVIYTRQIPVNIGGGQTINLITVPSTELVDENGQKQVNQSEIEPSIIKIVPQSQGPPNAEVTPDTMNSNNENNQNPQPQPVLTQMRIKLPMLSKAPQLVSGARVVRPSFFQIQRNVIGGANQPVYQQLVLTAAPPLGQQTIRLPQAQAKQIKVPESQSPSESQMSSSTLEQLREFDMVLEQVKERSTVQPNASSSTASSSFKLHASSSDTTDSSTGATSTPAETTQVLYSIGSSQSLNVAYVNRKPSSSTPTTSTYVRSPDSSGIADSPSSSSHSQIPHTVTTESTSSETTSQPKPVKCRPTRTRHKSSSNPPMKVNPVPPKPSTQKPLEDEQTTQRILYILAEYKEQVENSPDKDKPAPRRRSNPPSNPSGSSKRKKSSSGSRKGRDVSPTDDSCRTMGSEDSSCGTSQGDCNENCLETHSPQDSPRKVARKLTFEPETPAQQRSQPQRNVIVADGQTITVARGTAGKPATAVLMPANYILPVSMVKGGQQIAIVTNRGPKLLTVGGGEGGATNALLLQRLIGPAGLKPMLARPGVRHVRLPTAALHNLQAFNLATATSVQPPDSTASPASEHNPPDLVDTRAEASPWGEREESKPDRASSPDESEPWNLPSSADAHDYSYEETVRTDNMNRTVLVVQKKDSTSRHTRLAHVSAAALRHKYAILEHELRLQKSLSEECEDLGVDSPSASELFPEAELLFAASPAQDHAPDTPQHSHTPQPTILNQSVIQPDIDDQIATDQLIQRTNIQEDRQDIDVNLGLEDVGIVTVSEDGMQATIALDQEEFARSHPNTTFHSEPTDEGEVQPFTIAGLKTRHITSTIFHSNRAPATVLMTAPQTTVISQATAETSAQNVKYSDIDNMINSLPSTHTNSINLSSVLVKDDGLTRFDSILTDSRELHLSNTASAIVHPSGNATQVIRRVGYDENKRERERFLIDEPDAIIAGDDAKMIAEDSSRDATLESMGGDVDDDNSLPERHAELFWESNSASERSESRRPLDFSSDSEKCCKSPSYDETNSTDSSGVGTQMRLDSVIKEARLERSGSADGSSADDTHPPLRTYPPKRLYHAIDGDMERSLTGKTRAGERSPDLEVRRRASGRGVVKRGCHCCNGSPAPQRPKKPRQRKPTLDFTN